MNMFRRAALRLSAMRYGMLLVLAAIIPMTVTAAVVTQLYAGAEQRDYDAQLARAAERAATAVAKELSNQIELLTILSESPRLDPPLQVAPFAELAERLRHSVPVWFSVRVSDLGGEFLVASPPLSTGTLAVVDAESHARVAATGEPVVGAMVNGPEGKPGFAVRVPVVRQGQVSYIVSAVLRPETLIDSMRSSTLPSG
ncbi:hypothetical protein ACFSX5_00710 [Devosia albogilva]|uniref:Uncharacterized protein n=1 Tax=Devosia albogilva TaxID=429726 RepID=A0ABW5QFP7_9HYPH